MLFSILMLVMYPLYYYLLSNEKRHSTAFKVMRVHAIVLLTLTGVILEVKGANRIPKEGPCIICSNHSSFLDSFCLYCIVSRYFVFTGKKEIEKWPLFHIFYTSGMNIMVDRRSTTGSLAALRRMTRELNTGNPIAIFPEGTRPVHAPKLADFKTGAFALAVQLQVPIVPVSFLNNWKLLGRGGMFTGLAAPGISHVVVHPPVVTTGLKKTDIDMLALKVREIIGGPLRAN